MQAGAVGSGCSTKASSVGDIGLEVIALRGRLIDLAGSMEAAVCHLSGRDSGSPELSERAPPPLGLVPATLAILGECKTVLRGIEQSSEDLAVLIGKANPEG